MSVDSKIKEAIEEVVLEAGQPESLARKIAKWFEAIASGNEDISNEQSTDRHLELLYEETQLPTERLSKTADNSAAVSTDEEKSSRKQEKY